MKLYKKLTVAILAASAMGYAHAQFVSGGHDGGDAENDYDKDVGKQELSVDSSGVIKGFMFNPTSTPADPSALVMSTYTKSKTLTLEPIETEDDTEEEVSQVDPNVDLGRCEVVVKKVVNYSSLGQLPYNWDREVHENATYPTYIYSTAYPGSGVGKGNCGCKMADYYPRRIGTKTFIQMQPGYYTQGDIYTCRHKDSPYINYEWEPDD